MKRWLMCWMLLVIIPVSSLKAQDPITLVIKEGITKVIQAVDLKIQQLQNETIWLQNAQKTVENTLSQIKLGQIADWMEKQRVLYKDYFEELQKVKLVISNYYKVKEVSALQIALVKDYKKALDVARKDDHFTAEEIRYIGSVYTGIIEESLKNLDGLVLVIHSFATDMGDAGRMEIINRIHDAIRKNYDDLRRFTVQNGQLSLARAKDQGEINLVKTLYGL